MAGGFSPKSVAAVAAAPLLAAFLLVVPARANSLPEFGEWLSQVEAEALEAGVSPSLLEEVFAGLDPDPKVLELSARQPEFTETYENYTAKRLSDTRIQRGREMMAAHREELQAVAAEYGVQPRFIVAIWGLETNYGGFIGGHDVIRSLATLAFGAEGEGRRGFFRKELLQALRILDEGHIEPAAMKGSWAGAMGQGQFMPSSFLVYAEDFDGDGRRDIWGNTGDIFASIANYLARQGWRDDVTWGRRVTLPENFSGTEDDLQNESNSGCAAERRLTKRLPLAEWNALGLRRLNGDDLPVRELDAALARPEGDTGPAYLVYGNFVSLLRYNCSSFYALTVGRLSDLVKE